jgi:hypothetical protein
MTATGLAYAQAFQFVYAQETNDIRSFMHGFINGNKFNTADIKNGIIDNIRDCDKNTSYIVFGVSVADRFIAKCPNATIYISDSKFNISELERKNNSLYSAIFVDQSISQQSIAFQKHIPSIRKIGILYQTDHELSLINQAKKFSSLSYVPVRVNEGDSPGTYFRDLIKDVDAILITPNTNLWKKKDIRGFLLYSLRQGKVLLGGATPDFVRAGVLAGVYTDMQLLGEKVSIELIRRHKHRIRMHPEDGEFIYNRFLASRLSIEVLEY